MSRTATIELQDISHEYDQTRTLQPPAQTYRRVSTSSKEPQGLSIDRGTNPQAALPSPVPSTPAQDAPKWNGSHGNIFRVSCCFYALFMMGANDAAYGAIIPYVWLPSLRSRLQDPLTSPARALLRPLLHCRLAHLLVTSSRLHTRSSVK